MERGQHTHLSRDGSGREQLRVRLDADFLSLQILVGAVSPQPLPRPPSRSYFQRGAVREGLNFLGRTIVQRTQPGQRQSVKTEGYLCHVHVKDFGLAAIVICDQVTTAVHPCMERSCNPALGFQACESRSCMACQDWVHSV